MFIASSPAGTMLQCLACKHRGGTLKKISVPFTLRGKKILGMFLLILAGVKPQILHFGPYIFQKWRTSWWLVEDG